MWHADVVSWLEALRDFAGALWLLAVVGYIRETAGRLERLERGNKGDHR